MRFLIWCLLILGFVAAALNQWVWVPRIEHEQNEDWTAELAASGVSVPGELRPARELDVSEDYSGMKRAIGSIHWREESGSEHTVVAWDSSRPDLDWDSIHTALFGRPVDSAFWTGFKAMFGFEDPLLAKTDPVPIPVCYSRDRPGRFRLPAEFHRQVTAGSAKKIGRWILQALMWSLWWILIQAALCVVLGMPGAALPRTGRTLLSYGDACIP